MERQIAEKFHASTRLHLGRPSTRARDFLDLVLIARSTTVSAAALRQFLHDTFNRRATHPVPPRVPVPPQTWRPFYKAEAERLGLPKDLAAAHALLARMLDPILQGTATGLWNPILLRWDD
jgi:hypothetical protein